MTTSSSPHLNVHQQADQWWATLHSGHATQADAENFKHWLASSTANQQAWRELLTVMQTFSPALQRTAAQPVPTVQKLWHRRHFLMAAATASAAGVGALALYPPLGLWPALSDFKADYRTAAGEQRTVQFGQDVAVLMNTKTQINYVGTTGLELLTGEAEIQVQMTSEHPFSVQVGPCRMQIYAANVTVRYVEDKLELACLEGHVKLDMLENLELGPGQGLLYRSPSDWAIQRLNPESSNTWRKGYLNFNGVPLKQVIAELNRYRSGHIYLRQAHLGQRAVHLQLALKDMDLALDMLRALPGVKVQELPGGVALLSEA